MSSHGEPLPCPGFKIDHPHCRMMWSTDGRRAGIDGQWERTRTGSTAVAKQVHLGVHRDRIIARAEQDCVFLATLKCKNMSMSMVLKQPRGNGEAEDRGTCVTARRRMQRARVPTIVDCGLPPMKLAR